MKYSDISHGVVFAVFVVAAMYLIYAIWADSCVPDSTVHRKFARRIYARLDQIPDLDESEKRQIEDSIQDLIRQKEEKKTACLRRSCIMGAARGCLTSAVVGGGIEGMMVGGAVFGAMAPVMAGLEAFL